MWCIMLNWQHNVLFSLHLPCHKPLQGLVARWLTNLLGLSRSYLCLAIFRLTCIYLLPSPTEALKKQLWFIIGKGRERDLRDRICKG